MPFEVETSRAAGSLSIATALLVTAGAGMSEPSGLVDYDDPSNRTWPHPGHAKLDLTMTPESLKDPRWFRVHPALAWGFYGARLETCRVAHVHEAYAVVRRWAESMRDGAFVFTSSPEGQFQRARFFADRIVEAHGALEWLQCTARCGGEPFPGGLVDLVIDPDTGFAEPPLPSCPSCGALARPNVCFAAEDEEWDPARAYAQEDRMNTWLAELRARPNKKLVVVEIGARARDALVRSRGERVAAAMGGTFVRIEAQAAKAPAGQIGIARPPVAALEAIDQELAKLVRR